MKKSDDRTPGVLIPSGNEDDELQADNSERVSSSFTSSISDIIDTYQARLDAIVNPDTSTVSPLSSRYGEQEANVPGADDEEAGTAAPVQCTANNTTGTDQSSATPDSMGASATADEVFSAYLAPGPEERRRRWLENAVVATNVHVVEHTVRHERGSRKKQALVILCIVVAVIIGISLGVTLSGKDDAATDMIATMAPTSARFHQVAEIVESLYGTILTDPSSPQYLAAQWIADVDEAFEDISTVNSERFRQRYALTVFYFATGGQTNWNQSAFFLQPSVHECEWRDTPPKGSKWYRHNSMGVTNCTMEQWVQGIEINTNNLTGTLPQELGSLSSLTELIAYENNISGTLPPSLFTLSDLEWFVIWSTPSEGAWSLTGTIPSEIGGLTSLKFLALSFNSLTGTIPTEIGSLSNLVGLGLVENFLTGSIPGSVLHLSNLEYLDFSDNALTGKLPPQLFLHWPNLEVFRVTRNLLSGTIPNNLDSLFSLYFMELAENNFTGPFPSSITALTKNVTRILVFGNGLTGTLPNDWSNFTRTLRWLRVDDNHFTGTLPISLGYLSAFEILSLNDNGFNGVLPESLGNLSGLQKLHVQGNRLTGTVPKSFAQLTSLNELILHGNEFTGDLSFLCNGTDLLFPKMSKFEADCFGKVACPCCNMCCTPNDTCAAV